MAEKVASLGYPNQVPTLERQDMLGYQVDGQRFILYAGGRFVIVGPLGSHVEVTSKHRDALREAVQVEGDSNIIAFIEKNLKNYPTA